MKKTIISKDYAWNEKLRARLPTNRSLRQYDGVLGANLAKELSKAYDNWKRAGKPGGTFKILDVGAGECVAAEQMKAALRMRGKTQVEVFPVNLYERDYGQQKKNKRPAAASVLELPFTDNTFHFVTSVWAMPYVKDHARAVSEINRVLHPAGKAMIHVDALPQSIREGKTEQSFLSWVTGHGAMFYKKMSVCDGDCLSFEKLDLPGIRKIGKGPRSWERYEVVE